MNQEYEREGQTGTVAIRRALENRGYRDIGYNEKTGMVTIGGKDAIKPDYMDEAQGRSYATEQTISDGLRNYHEQSGDPLVRFTDHAAAKGGAYGIDANSVGFGNGKVTFGGQQVQPEWIDESGKAWIAQSAANHMIQQYVNQTGLQTPTDMYSDYQRTSRRELEQDIQRLQNREKFSYDPSKDEAFQSYLRQYESEGNRAAEDAAAAVSARTGGYMNSAAVIAAAQARNYYSQQAMEALPNFVELAYQRYLDDYSMDTRAYEHKRSLFESDYDKAVTANTALRDNLRYAAESDEERNRYYAEQRIADAKAGLELASGQLDYEMKQEEAKRYPNMLDYQAMLLFQEWMQGNVSYLKGYYEMEQAPTLAEYAAAKFEAELRYKNAQTNKMYR